MGNEDEVLFKKIDMNAEKNMSTKLTSEMMVIILCLSIH